MSDRALARRLRERLADLEPEVRRIATKDIPKLLASDAVDALLVALGDADWRVRKEAANVAPRVEPRTAVVLALARVLGDRDDVGRRNAVVEALVLIGPDAVVAVIDALDRLDADGRKLAVEVLGGAPTLAGMRVLATSLLADPDTNVVVAAAEALGQAHLAGEEAREMARGALTASLASPEPSVRLSALVSLNRLEVEVPWHLLEPLVDDPLLRRHALEAAAGGTSPRALCVLAEAASDPNATIARAAMIALGRSLEILWDDEEALDVVARALRSRVDRASLRAMAEPGVDGFARRGAILALGLVRDPDDVPLLAEALSDDPVADHAEAALQLFGLEAAAPLLATGRPSAHSLRGMAVSILPRVAREGGTIGDVPGTSEPLAALRDGLGDASADVVVAALKSLAVVGGSVDVEPVAARLRHSDPAIASAAHSALVAIATRHLDGARRLVTGSDPHGDRALAATIGLEVLARGKRATPDDAALLVRALAHRDPSVRRGAVEALAWIGGADAEAAVTMSLADEDPRVAHAAIRALGKLGRAEQLASLAATTRAPSRLAAVLRALREADPARAFAAARPLVRSPEPAVAAAAVEVVGAVATEEGVDVLLGAIDHPDHEVVKLALAQLVKSGVEPALVALSRSIEHAAEVVRRYAAELLGHVSDPEAEVVLRARLDRERSLDVRRAIMEALSSGGVEEPP